MNTKSTSAIFRFSMKAALGGFAALLMGGCASMTTAPTNAHADATVRIQLKSVAYYGSTTRGSGVLNYQGQRRNFTITSLGFGGTGGQNISAKGKVFNLDHVSDFPGSYRGVSRGLTLFEGKMYAKLTNANGVAIYLEGDTAGLASSSGVQSFTITFAN